MLECYDRTTCYFLLSKQDSFMAAIIRPVHVFVCLFVCLIKGELLLQFVVTEGQIQLVHKSNLQQTANQSRNRRTIASVKEEYVGETLEIQVQAVPG